MLVVGVADATSLGLLGGPGSYGADIAVAEGQSLGLPLQFGGPWAGLMACKTPYLRQLPGRITGQTVDGAGQRGFVLTLQAREQHIRREKATSNICTAQTLLGIGITAYLSLLGPRGLREVASQSHAKTTYAANRLSAIDGVTIATPKPFYNEILVTQDKTRATYLRSALTERKILGGISIEREYPSLDNGLLLAFTEQNTKAQIDQLVEAIEEVLA
jgi:glycine dehydrogenase subunit 1